MNVHILLGIHTEEDWQQDILRVSDWETDWLIKFNPTKCEKMTIPVKSNPTVPEYTLHCHLAPCVGNYHQGQISWNKNTVRSKMEHPHNIKYYQKEQPNARVIEKKFESAEH